MTESRQSNDLFALLPAVYRNRDADAGNILRNLFAVLQDAHDTVDNDIATLYENWFIETCAEWVVPYMGDLLGTPTLQTSSSAGFTLRGYVAATLSYRKRKGTAIVLEQLARDITNWPALAVEGFQLLATTQYMQHLRPAAIATVNLRDGNSLAAIGGPWDRVARTADVRSIGNNSTSNLARTGDPASGTLLRGKPNLNNLAIFLWRIAGYAIKGVTPRPVSPVPDGRFRFHPAGLDAPLFSPGRVLSQFTARSSPADVPAPLDRRTLSADLEALRQSIADAGSAPGTSVFFHDTPVFRIFLDGTPIPPEQISICDLNDVDSSGSWRTLPTSRTYVRASDGTPFPQQITVCVDPVLGRFAFPAGAHAEAVLTDYSYGFSGNLGGGTYDRTASLQAVMAGVDPTIGSSTFWQAAVSSTKLLAQNVYPDLSAAVEAWNAGQGGPRRFGVIVLLDSATYVAPSIPILVKEDASLLIVAATWPSLNSTGNTVSFSLSAQDCRAHLLGDLHVAGTAPDGSDNPGTLLLNGLLHEGTLHVDDGNLGRLRIEHCTLIPGSGTLTISADPGDTPGLDNSALRVEIQSSILGPILFPDRVNGAPTLTVDQSILDASGALAIHARGVDATITGSTVVGSIGTSAVSGLRTLNASNVLFTGLVRVERVQSGCARYCSFTSETVSVPRRFRCQPDLALANITDPGQMQAIRSRLTPSFTSLTYCIPAYAQLSGNCAPELRAGADDGSEMGAFGFLKQPQRDSNLRSVLSEYLRLSFEAGIFYVS